MTADVMNLASTNELILSALVSGPNYGAQIVDDIAEASDWGYFISFGNLYPTLHKLEERGLIESCHIDEPLAEERGSRKRQYYKLTEKGRVALQNTHRTRNKLLGDGFELAPC